MKIKIIALLIATLGITGISAGQDTAARVISLQECLKRSIDYSPLLKISELEQTKLRYQYRETMGMGLPDINFSGSFDDFINLPTQLIPGEFFGQPGVMIPVQFGTTYNLSGGLDASQIIYNQTYLVALRMSKLAMEQNRLETERSKIEVVFNVAQSFYYAQISRRQIMNLSANLAKLEKAYSIAKSQYDQGIIQKVDVDRINVNILNLRTEVDRLRVIYERQLNMQRYFMGLPVDQPIEFPDSIDTAPVDISVQTDLDNHIDIRLLEKQKQLATADMRMNQSEYFPSLTLIGSVNYTNQSNTYYVFGKSDEWFNTSLVGIRLNLPVFNGLQRHYKVSRSRVALSQLEVSEDDTRRRLSVQEKDALNNLDIAVTDEKRQRENMSLAERVYSISQDQYAKGVISLTDLLNAESGLNDAQTNHSLALVQMKISELEYLKATGKLLEIVK